MIDVDFGARLSRLGSRTYRELRPAQRHVLEAYASSHLTTPDVGIELPTGMGKTLVGLLIADRALDEGLAVAYLSGTRQLADQVAEQAAMLGGPAISHFWGKHYPGADLHDYHDAQSMGLMNYWVYFNSRPRVQPADVVIFDDAHIAEQPLSGLFTVRIARARLVSLYEAICDAVLAHCGNTYESLRAMRDGAATTSTPPELLAFNDWAAVADQVQTLISDANLAADEDIGWVWTDLRGRLDRCGILIGPTAIEIRPYYPPTQTLPGYSTSTQRVYLSATLGTMDDLQRRLGIRPPEAITTPPEIAMAQTGRRLFLVNPGSSRSDSAESLGFALSVATKAGRTAWLCSSNVEADTLEIELRQRGAATYRLSGADDRELDAWRMDVDGHLVTAGRFDGFDFRAEVCRLVVLPSVPAASTEFERFAVAYLSDAAFMRHRVGQRVTQALGRANRERDDWAVYLGLDPGFGTVLADPAVAAAMSDEVKPAVRVALEHHGSGAWADLESVAGSFLDGVDVQPTAVATRPGRRVASSTSRSETATQEVDAVTRLWLGDFGAAADAALAASTKLNGLGQPEHAAFWQYVRAQALWCGGRHEDAEAAKAALGDAVRGAPNTSWFVRLRRTLAELESTSPTSTGHDAMFLAWEGWLRDRGSRAVDEVNRARSDLTKGHDERAQALETLGRLCGAEADRPVGQSAADGRWRWNNARRGERRLWEIKTGEAAERVRREDVNQVLGQVTAERKYAHAARVLGCLVTPRDSVEDDAAAAAADAIALLNWDAVTRLCDLMADRFREYVQARQSGGASERGAARTAVEARMPEQGWLEELLNPSNGVVLGRQDVDKLFGAR